MPRPAHAFGLAFVLATVLALPAAATADGGFVFSRTLAGQPDAGHPQNAVMDASGNLLVADSNADAIWRFAPDATSTALVPAGGVKDPIGLAVQRGGFDVGDYGDDAVKRFDAGGTLLSTLHTEIGGSFRARRGSPASATPG